MKLKVLAISFVSTLAIAASTCTLAQTVVKVGSTPTGVPFTFLNTKTNTIDGAMVDIINAVGKEAGRRSVDHLTQNSAHTKTQGNKVDCKQGLGSGH